MNFYCFYMGYSIWILDGMEKRINIPKKEEKDILEIWNEIYERFKKIFYVI